MNSHTRIEATLAFIFNTDLTKVLLIKKQKPLEHKGLLNGLGGKLEVGESHIECLIREIEEEAVIKTTKSDWTFVGKMSWTTWNVTVWTMICEDEKPHFPDPNVDWYPVSAVPTNIISNLDWLIPLSLDINNKKLNNEETLPSIEVLYS